MSLYTSSVLANAALARSYVAPVPVTTDALATSVAVNNALRRSQTIAGGYVAPTLAGSYVAPALTGSYVAPTVVAPTVAPLTTSLTASARLAGYPYNGVYGHGYAGYPYNGVYGHGYVGYPYTGYNGVYGAGYNGLYGSGYVAPGLTSSLATSVAVNNALRRSQLLGVSKVVV